VPIVPLAVSVTDWPEQILLLEAVIPVGEVTPPAQLVDLYPKFLLTLQAHDAP
jgi:hypothetical protein